MTSTRTRWSQPLRMPTQALRGAAWRAPLVVTSVAVVALVPLLAFLLFGPRGLWLVLAAPVLEEIVLRLGAQDLLLKRGVRASASAALVALGAAAIHVVAWGDGVGWWTLAPTLVLGLVYARTKSVSYCMLLHAAMNAVWLVAAAAGARLPPLF